MVDNLSDEDIMKLRELLGFEQFYNYDEEENLQNLFGCSWNDKIKGKRKVQGVPQSQTAAIPRPQEEEETDKSKQAQTEQTYEKH